ncbi:MAG: phosphopantetheine-binding protein [Thiotrichaceae bacterium]
MLYKTGDLGRWLSNGEIEFLGRKDFQVKVRGFRIELGEIEHRLIQVDTIQQAVVVAREGNLVAYLVVNTEVQLTDLKKYLLEWLPDYMVPAHFIVVEKLPLTPNGKIDRNALPKLENSTSSTETQIAPRTELERQLAEIWRTVLGVATVGIRDNFFELGGHSLKAVQMVTQVRQSCLREVSLTQFFQQPTIEGVVSQFSQTQGMTRLNPATSATRASIICLPPILGYGVIFQPLAELLPEYAWYAVDFVENVPDLLEHYLRLLQALRLEHYILLGFSAGGTVTLKLARMLEQQGFSVSDVILLDSQRLPADLHVSDAEKDAFLAQGLQLFFSDSMGNREDVKRHTRGYAEFVLSTLDTGVVKANVHYIQAVGSDSENWSSVTHGKYYHSMGYGTHFDMLNSPHVAQNAQLLRQILENR